MPHDKHSRANDDNPGPSHGRDGFTQHKVAQQGHHAIGDRRCRLHKTIVGPGEHQDVGEEEREKRSDTEPYGASREGRVEEVGKVPKASSLVKAPTCFIPLPRRTSPKGPNTTIIEMSR